MPTFTVLIMSDNEKLVFNFFKKFARFEYAVKAIKLLQINKGPFADWFKLADAIESALFSDESISESIKYMTDHPPHQQVIDLEGNLKFDSAKVYQTRGRNLVMCVVNVRNNLFHGGKHTSTELANTERDQTLLQHSMTIIDACLRAHERLKEAYDD